MNQDNALQLLTIYIKLPDETGDILNISPHLTILQLADLIRQSQDLQQQAFDLYLGDKKLNQLFKTLHQCQIQDQDKIEVKLHEDQNFQKCIDQEYFLVVLYKSEKYQIYCNSRKLIYDLLYDFFNEFDKNLTQDQVEQYCFQFNSIKLQPNKFIKNYDLQSGSQLNLQKQNRNTNQAIVQLNDSCKIAQSIYIDKQPIPLQNQFKQYKKSQSKRLPCKNAIRLVCSDFFEDNIINQKEIGQNNIYFCEIKNPQSSKKISFDPVSPIIYQMDRSQNSPFCQLVNNFTEATKRVESWVQNMQIKQADDSDFTNSIIQNQTFHLQNNLQNSQQQKSKIIQNKLVESHYFSQDESQQYHQENEQIDKYMNQSSSSALEEQQEQKKQKTKCNQIHLTESFDAGNLSPGKLEILIKNPKKFSLNLTNESTGRSYKITFLEKNTIKDLKQIISDMQKIQQENVRILNSKSGYQYQNQEIFKDIIISNINTLSIEIYEKSF